MPVQDRDEVEAILRPHEPDLVDIVMAGWKGWWDNPDRALLDFKRTRACIVHNHMIREARQRYAESKKVRVIEGPETTYLLFEDRVTVRLKKGDAHGHACNIPTQTVLAFNDPMAFPNELPLGLPDVQRVDVVYVVNDIGTRVTDILVVARDGARILWQYGIFPRAADGATELPVQPTAPTSPDDVLRIPSLPDDQRKRH